MEPVSPQAYFLQLDPSRILPKIPEDVRIAVNNALQFLQNDYARGVSLLTDAYLAHPDNQTLTELYNRIFGIHKPAVIDPDAELEALKKEYEELLKSHAAELQEYDRQIAELQSQVQSSSDSSIISPRIVPPQLRVANKRKFQPRPSLPNLSRQDLSLTLSVVQEQTLIRLYRLTKDDLDAINEKDEDGFFLIHHIGLGRFVHLKNKLSGLIASLIELGVPIDIKDNEGNTALHLAAENNQLEVVKALIDFGADMEAKNAEDQTPLESADSCGANKTYEHLLQSEDNNKKSERKVKYVALKTNFSRV